MGRRGAGGLGLAFAVALATGPAGVGQDPAAARRSYLPSREVGIPVNLDALAKESLRPKELQLYTSVDRQPWKAGPKLAPDALPEIRPGVRGFLHRADADGGYEFAVQFHYPDGTANPPRMDDATPLQAVVVDTTPPEVRIRATGNGVEWAANDANLDPSFAEVQAKFPHWSEFKAVTDRTFAATDRHGWKLRPGDVLEVRVKARDRAGNDGYSRIVRVPDTGAVETSFPRGGPGEWLPPVGGAGGGVGASAAPQPRIEYVNKKDVSVDYGIQKVGRSGLKQVHLYVQIGDKDWAEAGTSQVNYKQGDKDPPQPLTYTAPADGVYGFYVAPESQSGQRARAPRKNDPPMLFVVVDTKEPVVAVTGVRVTPGPDRKPQVEIGWEAADPNLLPNPVTLEYAIDPSNEGNWKVIQHGLPNNAGRSAGRYVWDVPDELDYKFYVRVRAVDMAGNYGFQVWSDPRGPKGAPTPVIVDLDVPAATINGVKGSAPAPGKPN